MIIDVSEFLSNPIRTGIQRTVSKFLRFCIARSGIEYVMFDTNLQQLVVVPRRTVSDIVNLHQNTDFHPAKIRSLTIEKLATQSPLEMTASSPTTILIPELFYDHRRVKFYKDGIERGAINLVLLVYDFVPWLRPSLYRVSSAGASSIMPYLDLVVGAQHKTFISRAVRDDYIERISRKPRAGGKAENVGQAISLGADGLDMGLQRFSRDKQNIVCIGTFEGKKRQDIVFDGYLASTKRNGSAKLQFVGKVPDDLSPWLSKIVSYQGDDVEVYDGVSDDALYALLENARATIFTSTAEGFGLPAVESLFRGIPVVVHRGLPALSDVGPGGQIRIDDVNVETVSAAVDQLFDDSCAERLWTEAAQLRLSTWAEFSERLLGWAYACA